jgi:hypothetical protein
VTRSQFLDEFLIRMDKVSTLGLPGFEPNEVAILATQAQEELVIEKLSPKTNRKKEGFEDTEKRTQDLGELVRHTNITNFSPSTLDNGYVIQLPNSLLINSNDYSNVHWFTIRERVFLNKKDCNGKDLSCRVRICSHQELEELLEDPFNKPNEHRVLRLRSENRTYDIITDGTIPIRYSFSYIRKPEPIVLTSNMNNNVSTLADHVHRELLEKTLTLALKSIESQRLETEIKTSIE